MFFGIETTQRNSWLSKSWCRKDTCECICYVTFRLLQWITGWSTWQTDYLIDFKPSWTRLHGWSVVAVDTDILRLCFVTNCTGCTVASESSSKSVLWCTRFFMTWRRVTSKIFVFSLRRIRGDCHFVLQWWSTCCSKDINKGRRSSFRSHSTPSMEQTSSLCQAITVISDF